MKKRIVSLFLAVLMVLTASVTVFASDEHDDLTVGASVKVSVAGKNGYTDSAMAVVSDPAEAKYDFVCTLDMSVVNAKFKYYKENLDKAASWLGGSVKLTEAELTERFNAMETNGKFTITVTYPSTMTVPADYYTKTGEMFGFDDASKAVYVDTNRSKTDDGTNTTLKIELATRAAVTVEQLEAGLADIVFTVKNVAATEFGTATFTGNMTGETVTARPDASTSTGHGDTTLTLNYMTNTVSATASTQKRSENPSGPAVEKQKYTLTFDVEGDTSKIASIKKPEGTVLKTADFQTPYKDGHTFKGWFLDKELTKAVEATLTLKADTTVYAAFVKTEPSPAITGKLETIDHFAYVTGYPDGTVRPEANVTREETAMIFYRLLKSDYRATVESKTNNFSDVAADRWSNDAISTLVNAGIFSGYPDGTFKPSAAITRAEFATIVAKFAGVDATATQSFTDMKGHWADKYVATAVKLGWIAGYDDGTFRPDGKITRAEAMTLVNRILYRYVNAAGQHAETVNWPDNSSAKWYYYAVQEATNGHDYNRQEDGVNENWTGLKK